MLGYNVFMNFNKIRKIAIVINIILILIVLLAYALSNSAFNFKGNTLKQKQKVGMGYVREGKVEYKSPDVFLLGDFTANMASHDRSGKFVRVEIKLQMSDEDMADELKEKNIVIRDAVIEEMSLKRFSDVSTPKGKLDLKNNIKTRLNSIVGDGEIEDVYFTQFIIQ